MKFPELDELQTLAGKGLTAVGDAATSTTGQGLIGAAAQGLMGLGQETKVQLINLEIWLELHCLQNMEQIKLI